MRRRCILYVQYRGPQDQSISSLLYDNDGDDGDDGDDGNDKDHDADDDDDNDKMIIVAMILITYDDCDIY